MKITVKKLTACLLALIFLFALAACSGKNGRTDASGEPVSDPPASTAPNTALPTVMPDGAIIMFENGLKKDLNALYISAASSSEWGEPVHEVIASGEKLSISLTDHPLDYNETLYDVGMIDINAMNYDFYDVELSYGATLAVSGNEEGAVLTVTMASGTTAEYTAVINPNDDPHSKLFVLNPELDIRYDYRYDEAAETALAYITTQRIRLNDDDKNNFGTLSSALDEHNAAREEMMNAEFELMVEAARSEVENEGFLPHQVSFNAFLRRSDNRVLSVLYECEKSAGEEGLFDYSYSAVNFDVRTGEMLAVSDAVNNTAALTALINEQMAPREEDGFLLDTSADYSSYWSDPECPDYAWTLDYDGLTIIFNDGAFGIEDAYSDSVLISFSNHPELFKREYSETVDDFTMYFPWGTSNYIDLDGEITPIIVSGEKNEYDMFETLLVGCGEYIMEEEWEAFSIAPVRVHANGHDYLYIECSGMNDATMLSIFALSSEGIDRLADLSCGWYGVSDPENESYIEMLFTDPSHFIMTTRTDLLSTVDGSRTYVVADGLPESEQEFLFFDEPVELELKADISAYSAPDTAGETFTVSAGTKLLYYATDNEHFCCLLANPSDDSAQNIYLFVDWDDDIGPVIDGVAIYELFDGLMFAG